MEQPTVLYERKKVLICPLDWGLGHATRVIPIMQELIRRGCEVAVATSGPALSLLKKEFPDLHYYRITGYEPSYSPSGSLIWSLALQLPRFVRTIQIEHEEIESIVWQDGMEVVISDNRYGCWSTAVPSVMITHQLNIQAPRLLSRTVNFVNRLLIGKFQTCWVPDWEGKDSLAGDLSVSNGLPVKYIGPLSRFQVTVPVASGPAAKTYEILALVSGPEPQRKILENLLRVQLKKRGRPALLVCGLPEENIRKAEGSIEEVSHLHSAELNRVIQESEMVISRPGYSTIMDLARLGKKAIFIPTPGQTEQEYLGDSLMAKRIALCVRQDTFDLERALKQSLYYDGFEAYRDDQPLQKALDALLT
jgi:uncharacterized protein (TIGR00661 family)